MTLQEAQGIVLAFHADYNDKKEVGKANLAWDVFNVLRDAEKKITAHASDKEVGK